MRWWFGEFFTVASLFIAFWLTGALIAVACVPYIVIKGRDLLRPRRDPQVGLKVVLHFLLTAAIEGTLIGLTIILVHILTNSLGASELNLFRVGLGFAISGAILSGGYLFVLSAHTNDRAWPAARRAYAGIRVMLAGIVMTVSLVWTLILLLADADSREVGELETGFSLFVVWSLATTIEFFVFSRATRRPEVPGLNTMCVDCGYDLRTTLAGRGSNCPECGVAIPADQYEVVQPRGTAKPEATGEAEGNG